MQEAIDRVHAAGSSTLSGREVFRLYDTYGLEIETVREIAEEEQITIDEAGFGKLLEHRRVSSRAATGELQKRLAGLHAALAGGDGEDDTGETEFVGYDIEHPTEARVLRVAALRNGDAEAVDRLDAGEPGVAVLDRTSFYAESGGQVGDQGALSWDGGRARVNDAQKDTSGTTFHFLEVEEGDLSAGLPVRPEVDLERRRATERNHTATHLLHAALHEVVGEGARQAGSLVAPDRLRFDFTHDKPLTAEELRRIEDLANLWIRRAVATDIRWRDFDEARKSGAMALFGEKYGDRVRTVEIPGFSLELCGGCHVRNSGEIALVLITSERGVASGVRRIEALTGEGALELVRRRQQLLAGIEDELQTPAERATGEVSALKDKVKQLKRELARLRVKLVSSEAAAQEEHEVGGVRLVAREVPQAPAGELRKLADTLRDKLGSGVVVLAARDDEKVSLIATVSKDLTSRLSAGRLVNHLAAMVGGRGGGRPDFAQAGGKNPGKLPQLLSSVPEDLRRELAVSSETPA